MVNTGVFLSTKGSELSIQEDPQRQANEGETEEAVHSGPSWCEARAVVEAVLARLYC